MQFEVYSGTRPAARYRATLVASMLLAAALVLAAAMAHRRGGSALAQRIRPEGWVVSFRPPLGFQTRATGVIEGWRMMHFSAASPIGLAAELFWWERDLASPANPEPLCRSIIEITSALVGMTSDGLSSHQTTAGIGPGDGVEIQDAGGSLVARTAIHPAATAVAVSLFTYDGPVPEQLYSLFEKTAASVEFDDMPPE